MNVEKELMEAIKRFEDVKNQIQELQKKKGGIEEQQRALYNQGLELKGRIDLLVELQQREREQAAKTAPGLILPDKALVGIDGKTPIVPAPVVAVPAETPVAVPGNEVAAQDAAIPAAPVEAQKSTLEVV